MGIGLRRIAIHCALAKLKGGDEEKKRKSDNVRRQAANKALALALALALA